MKDKILMLIIGILIGAIIASGCFLIFGKNQNPMEDMIRGGNFDANMIGGGRFEIPEGMDLNNMGEPPARPEKANNETEI